MTHVVLDLETLGTRHDAVIFEIGAVAISNGRIIAKFFKRIQLDDSITIDRNTLMWWLDQGTTLRSRLDTSMSIPLPQALREFNNFLAGLHDYVLVGNGSTFDITILESAYQKAKVGNPTEFRRYRDLRTYMELYERDTNRTPASLQVTHQAVEDAEVEARRLIEILDHFAPKKRPGMISEGDF